MHPLDKFRYCPVCGSPQFEVNNFKSKKCQSCGFVYYANPCSATVAFIVRPAQGGLSAESDRYELLVARRAKEPAKDTLDLVGGFVDMDENVEQGMLREVQEETGMDLSRQPDCQPRYLFSIPNLYEYSGMTIHTLDMFFLIQVPRDVEVAAADDVAALTWMPLSQVDYRLFGLHSISMGVKRFVTHSSLFIV